jgi:hypothetical protein
MDNTQLAKEKEAGGANHQPLQDLSRAAQPERLNREEYSSGAAELQDKMKIAAKKLVELDDACSGEVYKKYHCLPGKPPTVVFRLGDEWLKITEENLTEAFKSLFPELDAEWEASFLLKNIRSVCKAYGKVSWTLPRLKGGAA